MRRFWLLALIIGVGGWLAAVIQAQPLQAPRVLTPEARAALERVYTQALPAAVRIETVPEGTGSGFFISADGLVMTAYHVIEGARSFRVINSKNQSFSAELVGYDEFRDIAILRAGVEEPMQFLPLETGSGPRVGEPLLAIGNSRGQFIAPRYGIVNTVERDIFPFFNSIAISTTIPLAPGDSGGPVLNLAGRVVAVVVAIGQPNGVFESYLSPLQGLDEVIAQLRAGRKRDVPYIGVQLFQIDDETAAALRIPKEGVLIQGLLRGGAAEQAGLRGFAIRRENGREVYEFDVILEADGRPFNNVTELQRYIRSKEVGDTIVLTVRRGQQILKVELQLTPNPTRRG
ncbi:S1C family serine protease [Meiothermus taiwanensis]|jgi:serine protease Do|uniref:Peptidase S1 and S6 chymotrypsin/Hap n=2 Tax=Meiothermus taiwanensis TaxID=172827 RepID=A0ABM6WJ54_9DEIN|nr:S1C family serine protease [Meiothermus taiwanensis]AWR87037.1 peptidase S1 and S6 chymotrypsin/Hap [Meiothermus taiwanensis WR-220]KIQ54364.1 peptidase S1 and S6 chymotrypsin/Hap [Meiothermus taiwanensis]KZK14727.1 peptidase S1 [Meiothermus taiwanensis]RIH74648.1 putative serine protease HhoB [Meiothermus taiwanensis]